MMSDEEAEEMEAYYADLLGKKDARIRELEEREEATQDILRGSNEDLAALTVRVAELEVAIRQLPHSPMCPSVYDGEYDCTCPKRLVSDL